MPSVWDSRQYYLTDYTVPASVWGALYAYIGLFIPFGVAYLYRRSRPSASGLDPEGEGRKLRWVFHFHCGWLALKIIDLLHWYWSE